MALCDHIGVLLPDLSLFIYFQLYLNNKLSSSFMFVKERDVPGVHASAVIVFPSPRDNGRQWYCCTCHPGQSMLYVPPLPLGGCCGVISPSTSDQAQ